MTSLQDEEIEVFHVTSEIEMLIDDIDKKDITLEEFKQYVKETLNGECTYKRKIEPVRPCSKCNQIWCECKSKR